MSKSIKIFLMVMLLTACTSQVKPDPKDDPVVFDDPIGDTVSGPVEIPYVWDNPINIHNVIEDETSTTYTNISMIDGLKNSSVQIKINTAIRNAIDRMISYADINNLPPFRGIKAKIKDGAVLINRYVYASVTYNSNNVLSLIIQGFLTFKNTDDTEIYLSLNDGLTFELVTGKQLHLSDIFTNEADISLLINNSLSKTFSRSNYSDEIPGTSMYYYSFTLVEPFKGIQADQAFYLGNQGLAVLFDYRTPAFDTDFATMSINVPFNDFVDSIGITERFSSNTDIYLTPIKDRQFLDLDDPFLNQSIDGVKVGEKTYKFLMRYHKDLPASLLAEMTTMKDKIKADFISYSSSHVIEEFRGDVFTEKVGSYTCLFYDLSVYSAGDYLFENDQKCFDKTNSEVNVADYFIDGFNYNNAIKNQFIKEIDKGYLAADLSLHELLLNMKVRITSTGLGITSHAYSASLSQDQFVYIMPSFSEFGISNLVVFD
ncbi:MAG: hypothetical protein HGB31_02735 [Erysipelotrichaceae bacterium]|nr:hypothetical protein [Erysipelotrichaceae bacterium]